MNEFPVQIVRLVEMAIDEDLGTGDITSEALLNDELMGLAVIEARESLVCSGLPVARLVFEKIDPAIMFAELKKEGETAAVGEVLAEVGGPVKSLLAAERTALNFLQRTCGVATFSRRYFDLAAGRSAIVDSRKTIPGWRWLDKMAVRAGGCLNHRAGLYDGVLVKDNHIAACGGIAEALARARLNAPPGIRIEIEVEDLVGLREAVNGGADIIMLDNFEPGEVSEAVRICDGRAELEISGGVSLHNIEAYLDAGKVDYISVGELTHSARAMDISLEIVAEGEEGKEH